MSAYRFELKGTYPLLMHANNIEARDMLEAERKRAKGKAGDDRSPASTWKTYLYLSDDTQNICLPFENLLSMLLEGGKKVKVSGKETMKTHSQLIEFMAMDFDVLVNGRTVSREQIDAIKGDFEEQANAVRDLGFRLSLKPCRIGKASHVRVRPIFHNWGLVGTFEIDSDDEQVLGSQALQELWSLCGRRIGLGDWRPGAGAGKPGRYGRFEASLQKV